jgi:hypothetical protein
MNLRRFFFRIIKPIARLFFKIKIPHRRKITYENYIAIESKLLDGDVILTRTNYTLANLFIKGYWIHAGIYRQGEVLHATVPVVRADNLRDFLLQYDDIRILRYTNRNHDIGKAIGNIAIQMLGKKYDYFFEDTKKRLYCSEMVTVCYDMVLSSINWDYDVILGVRVIYPNNINNANFLRAIQWRN